MKEITPDISAAAVKKLLVSQLLSKTSTVSLSKKTGLHRMTVSKHLRGKTPMSLSEFISISDALGLNPADVLHDAETESKEASDGND